MIKKSPERKINDSDVTHAISQTNVQRIIGWLNQHYGVEEATRRSLNVTSTSSSSSTVSFKRSHNKQPSLWYNANEAAQIICPNTEDPHFKNVRRKMIELANKKTAPVELGHSPRPKTKRGYLSALQPKTDEEKRTALQDFRSYHGLG